MSGVRFPHRPQMIKPKHKAVIFDFDDTLVETRAIKWEHHKTVAKKFYNIELSDETLRNHYGKPFNILLKELYNDSDTIENMIKANQSLRDNFLKKVYEGSIDAVKSLIGNGLKIGILSATNKNFVMIDLVRLNFPISGIDVIQGADETSTNKPDPDVFIPILQKFSELGVKKKDIVYVGDSLDDLDAAHGAGIDFIAVTTGLYAENVFKERGAKVVINNIKEVIEKII